MSEHPHGQEHETHGHEHHKELPHSAEVKAETAPVSSPSLLLQNANIKVPHFRDEEISFFFKGKKDPITKELIAGSKRPNVELVIPVLTMDGLIEKLSSENEKVQNFILDQVNNAIREGARMQVNDDEGSPVNRQSELDLQKLTIEYLASIPPSERKGTGIPAETWAEFEKDYIEVMVAVTKKVPAKVEKAAKLLVGKVNAVKGDKNVLAFLLDQVGIWATNTKNLEDFSDVFKYLDDRINTLLNKEEKSMLEAL